MSGKARDVELKANERKALAFVQRRFVQRGSGPSVRDLMAELNFTSPRSAAVIIGRLIELGYLTRRKSDRSLQLLRMPEMSRDRESTVSVPLVGSAACGTPLLAEENIQALIPVSVELARPNHRYFLLRAAGDSMTEAGIADGALVLVRQQPTANNGDIVVALVDDEATIKELRRSDDAVVLMPKSKNGLHKPIVLRRDFLVQGVVTATLPDLSE